MFSPVPLIGAANESYRCVYAGLYLPLLFHNFPSHFKDVFIDLDIYCTICMTFYSSHCLTLKNLVMSTFCQTFVQFGKLLHIVFLVILKLCLLICIFIALFLWLFIHYIVLHSKILWCQHFIKLRTIWKIVVRSRLSL